MSQLRRGIIPDIETFRPFEVSFESCRFAVRQALDTLLLRLEPLRLDPEERGTFEIVLAEVLNNIVEHSYSDPAACCPISVYCDHLDTGLTVVVTDNGCMMPDGRLPLGELAPLGQNLDDLPEGGFGWFMIRNLAKDVVYERIGNENRLSMRLLIGLRA